MGSSGLGRCYIVLSAGGLSSGSDSRFRSVYINSISRPDLDGSLAFLVAAMVFQKLTSFSGKTESEVYRLAGPAVSILKESLQLLC